MRIETVAIKKIKANPDNKVKYGFVCDNCGVSFQDKNWDSKRKFCSHACCWESKKGKKPWNKGLIKIREPKIKISRTGANCHFWKGGITSPNEKIRKSADYKSWRLSVFKRDKYACVECGKIGGYLHAHHKEKFSDNFELRLDVNNGTTLCSDCHAKKHGLVFTILPLNKCPDCGKRIKVGAKHCLPCRKKHTLENKKKCIDCGKAINRVSTRCRSCAAKITITKTENYKFWGRLKCNTKSSILQLAI